jgi:tetratricopeptide (TPR) repeat protein
MKQLATTFILVFFINCITSAQQYQPSRSDSFREVGDAKNCILEYKKELSKNPNQFTFYNLSCMYVYDREVDSAFIYLEKALKNDSEVISFMDPDFDDLRKDIRWNPIFINQLSKVEAKYGKIKNLELAKLLWEVLSKDQSYYYLIEVCRRMIGNQNVVSNVLWEMKKKLNDENQQIVCKVINTSGWPKKSEVGADAASAAFLVVQHADLTLQKKYLPMLKKACETNEAKKTDLALLIDRVELGEGRMQIYGSQINFNDSLKTYYVCNMVDPDNLEKRRSEMGFKRPFAEYVGNWNINWDIAEYKKMLPFYQSLESKKDKLK